MNPDVRRTLSHVIKHSVRPRPCDPDTLELHYKSSNLLSLSFPHRPVLYPSFMSRTGWGSRCLTEEELGACFELPPYVSPWDIRFISDIVPIQLYRSVLDHVTDHILPALPPLSKRALISKLDHDLSASPVSTDVWITSIGRWLPGAWSDAVIASKAVKSDNSPIDYKPWRRRIQLVLPCTDASIAVIERFATRRWRRNVVRSFFDYIRHQYGDSWAQNFSVSKRPEVSDSSPHQSKRRKRPFHGESSNSSNESSKSIEVTASVVDLTALLCSSLWLERPLAGASTMYRFGRNCVQYNIHQHSVLVTVPIR